MNRPNAQREDGPATPSLREKVAFLKRPESYPVATESVEAIETHMAWVFLTDEHAWKLKKPVRTRYLDFSTREKRRETCRTEVRLNRRLAPSVYLGVTPLTLTDDGLTLAEADGQVVDWLVRMRRLPRDRMLDAVIESDGLQPDDPERVADRLANFYAALPAEPMSGRAYRQHLAQQIEQNEADLISPDGRWPDGLLASAPEAQRTFLKNHADLFDARAEAGRIVEAHGDLRPEHVCLTRPVAVIDCLEFNRELRLLDTASELAFLEIECELLDAAEVGRSFRRLCLARLDDEVPEALLAFYRSHHACMRAKIAMWHLKDDDVEDREKWIEKGQNYADYAGVIHGLAGDAASG